MADDKFPLIFISHSRKDDALGHKLVEVLSNAFGPSSYFYDSRGGLKPGDRWWTKIVAAISQSKVFIVMVSENSVNSLFVKKEIDLAYVDSKKLIIPIKLDECSVPEELKGEQAIDLKKDASIDDILNLLVQRIQSYLRQDNFGILLSVKNPTQIVGSASFISPSFPSQIKSVQKPFFSYIAIIFGGLLAIALVLTIGSQGLIRTSVNSSATVTAVVQQAKDDLATATVLTQQLTAQASVPYNYRNIGPCADPNAWIYNGDLSNVVCNSDSTLMLINLHNPDTSGDMMFIGRSTTLPNSFEETFNAISLTPSTCMVFGVGAQNNNGGGDARQYNFYYTAFYTFDICDNGIWTGGRGISNFLTYHGQITSSSLYKISFKFAPPNIELTVNDSQLIKAIDTNPNGVTRNGSTPTCLFFRLAHAKDFNLRSVYLSSFVFTPLLK